MVGKAILSVQCENKTKLRTNGNHTDCVQMYLGMARILKKLYIIYAVPSLEIVFDSCRGSGPIREWWR